MKNIFVGKTIEEAKMNAVDAFGVSEELISFTVLEEPKKGFLGIIKGEAKVEAEYIPASSETDEEPDVSENMESAAEETVPAPEVSDKPKFEGNKAEAAVNYIFNIFDKMGVKAEYTYEETEDGVVINLTSEDTSFIIGRRGENLDAIQYLASMFCNRLDDEYYRVVLDSNGYRDKRKKTLEDLAKKIAKNVLRSGRSTVLEPMNPYERRVIHANLQEKNHSFSDF